MKDNKVIMTELHNLEDKYRNKFGEPFPLYMVLGMDDDEIVETISKCVDSNKEYEPTDNDIYILH